MAKRALEEEEKEGELHHVILKLLILLSDIRKGICFSLYGMEKPNIFVSLDSQLILSL